MDETRGRGPLADVRVLEIASIGPGPFAAQVLAGLGADVVRVARPDGPGIAGALPDTAGRPEVAADLKSDDGRALALSLAARADALLEGFRPGVMERLGLGPEVLLEQNPRLVYARVTGYGQDGPMAQVAGHDVNYLAMSGVLSALGRAGERPVPPVNLLADYGGGGMLAALGIVSAVLEARSSGRGQVVDAAMVDGVVQLGSVLHGLAGAGRWGERGTNLLDTGAPFYDVYGTADGGHMAVGAIEPQFYAELLRLLEIPADEAPQWDQDGWPALRERFAAVFASRPRDEWATVFERAEACTTPVLGLVEATRHPWHRARGSFTTPDGVTIAAPAPRFDRTPGAPPARPDADAALARWGVER